MADRVNRHASTSSRHSLRRYPSSSQSSNSDVFSDSHAIDPPAAADGEAPRSRPRTPPRMSLRRSMTPRAGDDAQAADALKRRSSLQQGGHQALEARNSFSLRNDAPVMALHRNPSSASRPEMTQRPTSMVSSSFSMPRAQSPFVGASGPSHPYNMYPQDAVSLNRSSTGSTIRHAADRPYPGPTQPIHPYALYSQATEPETQQDPLAASADIATVGFPGLNQGLSRRLGPDGEDADDLVGADGYTEQLPPYTRYPEMVSKERFGPDGPLTATTDSTARPSAEAPRDGVAEAQSRGDDDDGDEGGGDNSREAENDGEESVGSDPSSQTALNKPKWMRSKRRFFKGRIPAWAVCLGVLLIVLIAAAVGGVIGMYLAHKNPPDKHMSNTGSNADPDNYTSTYPPVATTIIDATPLTATPTNLPALPTGDFGFQLASASEASSACLTEPGQAPAWSCASEGFMLWNVTASDVDTTQISLIYGRNDWQLCYGAQPPDMPDPTGLQLMEDVEQPQLGPAYFFQSQYTKTVILPADTFDPSASKRSMTERFMRAARSADLQRRDVPVAPYDQPWVCYWNNTLLEGFIYVTENSLPSSLSSSSPSSSTPATTPPPTTATAQMTGSSGSSVSSAYATPAPSASGTAGGMRRRGAWGARDSDDGGGGDGDGDDDDDDDDGYTPDSAPVPPYPRALKVEERRLPNNPVQPYCQQMTVSEELTLSPLCDDDGKTMIFQLDECEPEAQQHVSLGGKFKGVTYPRDARYAKRDQTACLCQWMV